MTKKLTKLADLTPDGENFNKHTQYGQKLLEDSLRKFGAGRSVLVDKDGNIIAGNGVVETAAGIGMDDVVVVQTDGTKLVVVQRTDLELDTPEGRELALADNMTALKGIDLDLDKVRESLGDDLAKAWGMEIPEPQRTATEDDFDPDKPVETVCKKGDIWKLGKHRLMCGDSTDAGSVALLMDGEKADMCFTDPPYGVSIGDKNKTLNAVQPVERIERNIENDTLPSEELYKVLVAAMTNVRENCKDDASYYVTSPQGGELGLMMMMMKDAGLYVRHMLIWVKNVATFSMGRLDYDYRHEPIFYTWTKSHHFYGKAKNSVIEDDLDVDKMKKDDLVRLVKDLMDKTPSSIIRENKPIKNDLHPTMKPVSLVGKLMNNNSREGDNVIDLFGGSGTTLIAAEQLNRKCFMMELDPHYCDVIIARWEKLTGNKAERISNGND